MSALYLCLCILLAYLFGSISFGITIGLVFFKKDIRLYGSKNSGGTNAGRVLGKKIGLIVILLDALKCVISILFGIGLFHLFKFNYADNKELYTAGCIFAGLFAGIGHCYPIFYKFKGGKAASTAFGFVFMTNIFIGIGCFFIFFTTLFTSKYVSLSSMICAVFVIIASWVICLVPALGNFGMNFNFISHYSFAIASTVMCLLLIYRHHANIKRLIAGNENKINWFKSKDKNKETKNCSEEQ